MVYGLSYAPSLTKMTFKSDVPAPQNVALLGGYSLYRDNLVTLRSLGWTLVQ